MRVYLGIGSTGPEGPDGPQGPDGPGGPAGPQGPSGIGANWQGAWNSGTTYVTGMGVSRSSINYISVADGNINHDPATDGGSHWEVYPLGAGNPVYPEDKGAVGDGTTDDSVALTNWLGSGKYVALTPGKTYLIRQPLTATVAGQKLEGNGATIKAAAQVSTTTTTTITSGTTSALTVASTTGLKVGDRITVEQPGISGATLSTALVVTGTLQTSLPVNALPATVSAGTFITVVSGSHAQTFTVLSQALSGATSINVYPQLVTYAFPINSSLQQSGNWDLTAHTIQSIVGSVVTISDTFQVNLSGTTNVHTSLNRLMTLTGDNQEMSGFILDGTSGSLTWSRWSSHGGITAAGNEGAYVHHNRLINQAGDALETNACSNAVFAFNTINSATARGFSFGSSSGPGADTSTKVVFNRFYNCDTDPLAGAGDHHGNINFSQGGQACLVHGNYIDTGMTGIGGLNGPDTQKQIVISDNIIKNCSNYAIDVNANGDDACPQGTIHDNIVDTCGPIALTALQTGFEVPTNWKIHDNVLTNSNILIAAGSQIDVHDNQVNTTAVVGVGIQFTNTGSNGVTDSRITNNTVTGFIQGIAVGSQCDNVRVSGNICDGQINGGIQMHTSANPAVSNVTCTSNTVIAPAAASSSYEGIDINGTCVCSSNTVDVSAASGANVVGIRSAPNFSALVAIQDNTITVGASGGKPIFVVSGTTTSVLRNTMDTPYTDSGTGTDKRGNKVSAGPVTGTGTLVNGVSAAITTAEIQAGDTVHLSRKLKAASTALGELQLSVITVGTSFVVNSVQPATPGSVQTGDQSTFCWEIVH